MPEFFRRDDQQPAAPMPGQDTPSDDERDGALGDDLAPDQLEGDDDRDRVAPADLARGDVVAYRYFDPYTGPGGSEVTKAALVLEVDDDDEGDARVAVVLFDQVSVIPASELTKP